MRLVLPSVMTAIPSATLVVRTSASIGPPLYNVISKRTFYNKTLLVAPRFCNHLRKHSLAQAGLKRSLGILQQLDHCLFMSAARSASLFSWILVNRKNKGLLYRFVNL